MQEYEVLIETINPCGGEAVSYTHLDVYKRQVLRRTSIMASICSCGCGSSSINPESVCGLICAMVVSSL